MKPRWTTGNRFDLLENGEAFFPRVFEAIGAARHEVLIETFILFEDKVGLALHKALLAAAQRGMRVELTVDGYGSHDLSTGYIAQLTDAGVGLHVFDPQPRVFGMRYNLFRRMHRKIVVVDGRLAFVGGINYSSDHLADFGPEAKQDYSVEIEGPIVDEIHRFVVAQLPRVKRARGWLRLQRKAARAAPQPAAGAANALFVTRDNRHHRTAIERHYRAAIRGARRRILIANAYFFPGYGLLRDLRRAARRGVDVRLVLQGEPDMQIVKTAAALLYEDLLQAGVRIYEYTLRPLHGKVALVDDEWSTVGSSNLDPLSLSLNLEANVMIHDREFNGHLADRLHSLIHTSCSEITFGTLAPHRPWSKLRSFLVYHLLRLYPRWATLLPAQDSSVISLTGGHRPESPA